MTWIACLALLYCGSASAQAPDPSAANIRADMAFLASDRLKGREAGTPEYDMAAKYVADQMKQIGLVPDLKGSYFQHVPLTAFRTKDQGALSLQDKSGHATPLVFGTDYLVGGNALAATVDVNAPLVFVGFGVVAPEHARDDYAGLDVKGKIVVALSGAPKFLQSEERAYYGNARNKLRVAWAHGAAGFVSVDTPTRERLHPFANAVRQYQSWGMTWRKPDGKPFVPSPLPGLASISITGAPKLLGADTAHILAAAETTAGDVRGFALPLSLHAVLHSEIKNVESENIVGLLPGTDPQLKKEFVVLSAHLDHIGITPPVNGDSINNGALDNASGVATTLEVARLFKGKIVVALSGAP
ncbi:MAG TPA: M28 family peptidase, partial [Rhizomicrobium sp.]|nr:M28 family peptidase [Rhizomicrobium sp.]